MEYTQLPSATEVEQELKRERYKRRYRRTMKSTIFALITAAAAAVLVATLWLPVLQIFGSSMTPTLQEGEIVVSVKADKMEPGDIVAFYYGNKVLVKRYIAGPGVWVDIQEDGTLLLNGEVLEEPYLTEKSFGICTLEDHEHGEGCFEEQTYACEIPESEEHSHSESCTGTRTVQICTLEVHAHGEGCYEEQTLVCEIPEGEGHAHSESCYTMQLVFCDQPTAEDHAHEEGCYQTEKSLTCGLEEIQAHTHGDTCRDPEGNLTCTLPEILVHTHTEECLQEQTQQILQCTLVEHTHEATCAVEDLDLTADVETEEDWKKSVTGMTRTGIWPADVLAVAETQLGYRESVKNVVLIGDELKGYTRYGAWNADPYGDWNTLFVAFCLDYAGVTEFPVKTDVARWVEVLTETQQYRTPDKYTPKAGDLIFIDENQGIDADDTLTPEEKANAKFATPLKTNENGFFQVIGLDINATYYLKETKKLDGYDQIDDIEIVITGAYDETTKKIKDLMISVDRGEEAPGNVDTGIVSITVVNNPGKTLPSTGGVGTTMFYVFGGLMVAAALVLLITKKRMAANN